MIRRISIALHNTDIFKKDLHLPICCISRQTNAVLGLHHQDYCKPVLSIIMPQNHIPIDSFSGIIKVKNYII